MPSTTRTSREPRFTATRLLPPWILSLVFHFVIFLLIFLFGRPPGAGWSPDGEEVEHELVVQLDAERVEPPAVDFSSMGM